MAELTNIKELVEWLDGECDETLTNSGGFEVWKHIHDFPRKIDYKLDRRRKYCPYCWEELCRQVGVDRREGEG